jgi:hypothetical protein
MPVKVVGVASVIALLLGQWRLSFAEWGVSAAPIPLFDSENMVRRPGVHDGYGWETEPS